MKFPSHIRGPIWKIRRLHTSITAHNQKSALNFNSLTDSPQSQPIPQTHPVFENLEFSPQAINPAEWKSTHAFYDNSVDQYAQKAIQPLTLEYLMRLGEHSSSVSSAKIDSAKLVSQQLPQRLARRVKGYLILVLVYFRIQVTVFYPAMQTLPFIVGVNPWIKSIYKLYHDSFLILRDYPPITDDASEAKFSEKLKELVGSHTDVIPKLAKGFQESGKYMSKEALSTFLDDMIRARIGIRVLAEHHLALRDPHKDWIGVVHTKFVPYELIRSCCVYVQDLCEINYGSAPEFSINGDIDTIVTYLPVHLEYILLELLKNAMRATVERSNRIGRPDHPPVEITICRGVEEVSIRIRDQGGGVSKKDLPFVFDYSYTTVPSPDEIHESASGMFAHQSLMQLQNGVGGPMAGLGFGLPMSRIYARYFGGSLELVSIAGHGCDVFVQLPNITGIATSVNI
ncbi:hypothetical protein HK098_001871 [Nowakowskiella sp. JEL0407]|nr:hypothetical protein HK098_001871 [Nowakowskiella sp. JEL0407]